MEADNAFLLSSARGQITLSPAFIRIINFTFRNSVLLGSALEYANLPPFTMRSALNKSMLAPPSFRKRVKHWFEVYEFNDWALGTVDFVNTILSTINTYHFSASTLSMISEYKDKNTKLSLLLSLEVGKMHSRNSLKAANSRMSKDLQRALSRLTELGLVAWERRKRIALTRDGIVFRNMILGLENKYEMSKAFIDNLKCRNRRSTAIVQQAARLSHCRA
jgi:hypothetical protein